ncbi:MAG TPA: YHS domain-containing protein, partial [Ancylobacter sp.]
MAKDPVCGMQVAEDRAAATAQHAGKTFYFCSSRCHDRFVADPAAFVTAGTGDQGHDAPRSTPPAPAGAM